jgi:membrane protein insertase Oxa1/YidC/SpoIIIJ
MFWQHRITPSTGDPRAAGIMMLMPLMVHFMFLFPCDGGLVIYWFVETYGRSASSTSRTG